MDCWELLTSDENLRASYRRARRELEFLEGFVDHEEFAEWENDLDQHIDKVRQLLLRPCEQVLCNLVPVPKGKGEARAYYSIPLEYQVGWLAIVGAIGPLLDKRMPNWSFGYRLQRPRIRTADGNWPWDEHSSNSEGTYLSFARSWKPFRRYANLTLTRFLGDSNNSDDPAELLIQEIEARLSEEGLVPEPGQNLGLDLRTKRFPFFADSWPRQKKSRVWFARLDIENFFPSIERKRLPDILVSELTGLCGFSNAERWQALFDGWLKFVEASTPVTPDQLKRQRIGNGGLPVGLVASGFLANVYMLPVDREIERVREEKFPGSVAALRYVDDFVVLAGSKEDLAKWLSDFIAILRPRNLNLKKEKIHPELLCKVVCKLSKRPKWNPNEQNLRKLLKSDFETWQDQGTVSLFDRKEFISTTLQRMSFRAAEDPEMLDESELQYRFLDLLDLAAAGTANAEVRSETLHSFAAGQLQRTPLYSPAPLVPATNLTDHSAQRPNGTLQAVQDRIRQRGMLTVRQLLTAVTAAPQKHKLIGRCVQVATELAQFLPADSTGQDNPLDRLFHGFLQLLTGNDDSDEGLTWHLGEKEFDSLRPALLSFLRMRFWNAVSDVFLIALRNLRHPTDSRPAKDMNRPIPHRTQRLIRSLTWLQNQARWLKESISVPDRLEVGFVSKMEAGSLARWRQLDTLATLHLTGEGSIPSIQRASPTPPQLVEYGQWLLSWSGPDHRGPLAPSARQALKNWVASSLKDSTHWTQGEHRLISAWLLQDPQKRLGNGRILKRLIDEQSRWPENVVYHSPYACKWLRELLWSYASFPDQKKYFDIIQNLTFKELNGCRISMFVSDIIRQVGINRFLAQKQRNQLCSLQYLMESELSGTGRLQNPSEEVTYDAPEALRVLILLSLLTWVQESAKPGMSLSSDNLFVRYEEFCSARTKIERGDMPPLLKFRYKLVLKDRFYEIDGTDPDIDKPVVAGMVGIQLMAGPRALDHVLRRRPRRQLDAQDILGAFEDAPATSRDVTGLVAGLCMFPRWQRLRANHQIIDTYTNLLGVSLLTSLNDAVAAAQQAYEKLFDNCTRRDGKATYLITPGVGQRLEDKSVRLDDWLAVGVIQPNLDLDPDSTWYCGAKQLRMSEDFAELHAWPAIWHGLRTIRSRMRAATTSTDKRATPAVVVIPELMVPRRRVTHLKRYAQRENMIIIAGVEYRSAPGWLRNEAVVIIPAEDRTETATARCFWIAKRYPAPSELKTIKTKYKSIRFVTSRDLAAVDTKQTGKFGVSVCYDLYAVQTLVGFQGKILHLFVAAYNRDIQTFDSLSDAAMRLLFCNVVIANGGTYGGSVAVSPYYDPHRREVLRIRGQEVDAAENFHLPLQPLRLAQRGEETPSPPQPRPKKQRLFKDRPADWSQ